MNRWARLDSVEDKKIVGEIITYDPQSIIHEDLLDRFVPCDESVTLGYYYDKETQEFYVPESYGKKFLSEVTFSPVPSGFIVGENYLFISDPNIVDIVPPKFITEYDFRSKLILSEKLIWDSPETGTPQQKAAITTMKNDFPFLSVEDMQDELNLLESLQVIGVGRASEIAYEL